LEDILLHLQEELVPGEFFDELARVDRVELDGKVQGMRRPAFHLQQNFFIGIKPLRLVRSVDVAQTKIGRLHKVQMLVNDVQYILTRRIDVNFVNQLLFVEQHDFAVKARRFITKTVHFHDDAYLIHCSVIFPIS